MKHFISYHNVDKMGYPFEDAEPFSVGTSKSVERLRGERVWSISGDGHPRRYHLRDTWIVDEVGESVQVEFSNYARGYGVIFAPAILLSGLPWFPVFLKSQSNFSLGLQQIKDEFVPNFNAILTDQPVPVAVQAAGGVQGEHPAAERLALPYAAVGPVKRVETIVYRIVRDTPLTRRIKTLHNYECQLCGHVISLPDGSHYAEGHHIQPLGDPHNGPDTAENVLCLCPNHHAACDLGAILLAVDDLRQVDGHVVGQRFLDYHNLVVYCCSATQTLKPVSGPPSIVILSGGL